MVARSAASFLAFSPAPAIAVAGDGTLAAIVEPTRVIVVELPDGNVHTEVGLDTAAVASDVAWVGTPPKLLVLSRYEAHTSAHLVGVGVDGPRSIAEIRLESPMRLVAAVGAHALVIGSLGAAILTAFDAALMPYQFLSRSVPIASGVAGALFVVALPATIEEWDPASRTPKRRLRLPRPATITAVGGSERVVWMTTQQDPSRIDVLPLVNRGQPKQHELPEPIAGVYGHPRSDIIACTGADSGRLYVVDLDGRTRLRTVAAAGIDRVEAAGLVVGRTCGVIAAQTQRPLAIIALDGREPEPRPSTETHAEIEVPEPRSIKRSTLSEPPPATEEDTVDERPKSRPPTPVIPPVVTPSVDVEPPSAPIPPRAPWTTQNVSERFSALRERGSKKRDEPSRASWRDDVVLWSRAIVAGTFDKAAPIAPPIEALVARIELKAIAPALVLLYGVHLLGIHGAAPVDVARVLGRSWDEALGTGRLAALELATYERSRVILAEPIVRMLDDRPPATGTLVGEPGTMSLLGPCAVVATDSSLVTIAERLVARVGGAILAAHDAAEPCAVLAEARARGAAPLLRASAEILEAQPMILVVTDDVIAEQLGLPILA